MPYARLFLVGLFLVAGLAAAMPADAAIFTVTTTTDSFDGQCDSHCSLREAIAAANAAGSEDEVHVPAGVYPLSLDGPGEDSSATGDLDVRGTLKLVGAGAKSTVIDGLGLDRVLQVITDDPVEISDLTLRNGHARNTFGPVGNGGGESHGGGLANYGLTVKIHRCHIAGNAAELGGGIYNLGLLQVRDSTISGNSASHSGGGLETNLGFMELTNVTISGNVVTEGGGGAIFGLGAGPIALIESSTITDNSAPFDGGVLATAAVPEVAGNEVPLLRNTLVAGNHSPMVPECGLDLDADHNLRAVTAGCETAQPFPLGLAPLADNGGPTPTHALLQGSPAIDAGPTAPGATGCTAQDQRGRPRPADGNGDGASRCDVGAFEKFEVAASCASNDTTLCLGGRFRVTAHWTRPDGSSGDAHASAFTPNAGYYWFFDPANVEVIVKSIDACADFDRFWIFLGGLTNVDVELRVEDILSGTVQTYHNAQGHPFAPIFDTDTFAGCP